MKKLYSTASLFILCLLMSSCGKDLVFNYANYTPNSGNIVIKPTKPVSAYVTVNDSLVVSCKYVRSVTIKNLPPGSNYVHFSGESEYLKENMNYKSQVVVEKGKTNTQLVPMPPKSNGYHISQSITLVGLLLIILYPW